MNQLSAEEAATLLGVSQHTLQRLIFMKGLPATEIGFGCYTIDETALRQWIEANAAALQSLPNGQTHNAGSARLPAIQVSG